jgi:hypothetical protein
VAVAAGVVGFLLGLLVGWGLGPDPDPAEVLGEVEAALWGAEGSLEVVEVEYGESVTDGEVVATPEYEGARAALASSRNRYLEVRQAVASVAPNNAAEIDRAYDELKRLVDERAPTEQVASLVTDLAGMLTGALGE